MKKILLIRFFILGLLAAVVLSVLSMLFMNQISEMGAAEHRKNFMLSLASSIESHPLDHDSLSFFRGPPPHGPPPPFGPPPHGPGGPPGRPTLWVVGDDGAIISATNKSALPISWAEIPKPGVVHEFATREDWLKISPGIFVLKLAGPHSNYLVLQEERRHLNGPFFFTQMVLLFGTVCTAVFLALSLTFYYLQKKSKEAKAVLFRLEKGDLKARFEIKAFDEFANLLVDFNRMAEQIEKLVNRVQDTENTRTNLLQELGHDLRTPLTGLKTSFETLKFHWTKMTEPQREELFDIMGGEIEYVSDLLDKLMTISNLDEPHYRTDIAAVDLEELVSQEVKARQAKKLLKWSFVTTLSGNARDFVGDPHLILRMLRNALDNANKYAETNVVVSLSETPTHLVLQIQDDGPGFSEAALQTFGHRLEHRVRRERGERGEHGERGDGNFSLGLGSVIMKTIAELHGGVVRVFNLKPGAAVEILLPKAGNQS